MTVEDLTLVPHPARTKLISHLPTVVASALALTLDAVVLVAASTLALALTLDAVVLVAASTLALTLDMVTIVAIVLKVISILEVMKDLITRKRKERRVIMDFCGLSS
jgi:hypothetical protein